MYIVYHSCMYKIELNIQYMYSACVCTTNIFRLRYVVTVLRYSQINHLTRWLLERGADPTVGFEFLDSHSNRTYQSASRWAVTRHNQEILKLVLPKTNPQRTGSTIFEVIIKTALYPNVSLFEYVVSKYRTCLPLEIFCFLAYRMVKRCFMKQL